MSGADNNMWLADINSAIIMLGILKIMCNIVRILCISYLELITKIFKFMFSIIDNFQTCDLINNIIINIITDDYSGHGITLLGFNQLNI
ncbi:hypothetical protein BCR32DRAFT_278574 [Anaeromyces robustus]|uniref:Uncharacterized protein n=1 Tax=Anaeromyces robustus TaxID=1754192 RepID=A0A1Y1XAR7_9FUNG|nr:hypothetical protein BCR32DRAFT_278574 [Anaeromyces robustus]|eukprot:ORX82830.1 hypothetical protein BCR32DRAFT_278574 [Anaeromyces robustus]